jgi:hypothetical protein
VTNDLSILISQFPISIKPYKQETPTNKSSIMVNMLLTHMCLVASLLFNVVDVDGISLYPNESDENSNANRALRGSGFGFDFTGNPGRLFGGNGPLRNRPRAGPKNIDFNNDTCAVDPTADPVCVVGSPGQEVEGAWVCRTLYDTVTGANDTFSACVDTDHFIATDSCGCCNGVCPAACACPCDLDPLVGDGAGVLVIRGDDDNDDSDDSDDSDDADDVDGADDSDDEDEKGPKCVDPEKAYKMITGPGFGGRAVCVEECPITPTP